RGRPRRPPRARRRGSPAVLPRAADRLVLRAVACAVLRALVAGDPVVAGLLVRPGRRAVHTGLLQPVQGAYRVRGRLLLGAAQVPELLLERGHARVALGQRVGEAVQGLVGDLRLVAPEGARQPQAGGLVRGDGTAVRADRGRRRGRGVGAVRGRGGAGRRGGPADGSPGGRAAAAGGGPGPG